MFNTFQALLERRAETKKSEQLSNLNQGTTLPIVSLSPYSFSDTFTYASGLLFGDRVSSNQCKVANPGRSLIDHVVGVRKGELNATLHSSDPKLTEPLRFCVVGDVMVSKSGHSIRLNEELLNTMCATDVVVINVEAPVSFATTLSQRGGLNFIMSQNYLKHFVDQLKNRNPNLTIVYDIANNHSLDGREFRQDNSVEAAIEKTDTDNFPLLRTVAAIREIDPKAVIIGAHLAEDKYRAIPCSDNRAVDCYVDPVAVIEKNGVRCGFIGFTDILNHNAYSWDKRVVRTEDIPADLEAIKKKYNLSQLYLIGHGNIEQCIYPRAVWRAKMLDFLNGGADAVFGHGPHVPLTNEVITVNGRSKFIAHSVGNLYGPTKLNNTGLNCLALYTVHQDASTAFEMMPIEAVHDAEGIPVVKPTESNTNYPHLLQRYQQLYPLTNMPVTYSLNHSLDKETVSSTDADFIRQLELLRMAADNLLKNNRQQTSAYADKLYNELSIAYTTFCSKKDAESYQTFKTTSFAAIREVDKNLSNDHRLKKIMLNIALAVITLGIGYVVAAGVNKLTTGRYTFFNQHSLSKQLDEMEQVISNSSKATQR